MLILALDTATPWGRFALAQKGRLLAEQPVNAAGTHAHDLLWTIDGMLRGSGHGIEEVGAVGVTCGPGGFTGVRLGLATAKALAWGLEAKLVAVPTLAAMAAALLATAPERELAVPVLDARRGELFAAVYRRQGVWVVAVADPAALPPEAWWSRIRAAVPDLTAPVWGGAGLGLLVGQGPRLRPELAACGQPVLRDWSSGHPATARALALAMADPEAALPAVHPFTAEPLYLRASEAEVKRELDLTPRWPGAGSAEPADGEAL